MADGAGTREVKIGVRGDSYTQITSGLNEGDRVDLLQGTIGGTTNQTGQGGGTVRSGAVHRRRPVPGRRYGRGRRG